MKYSYAFALAAAQLASAHSTFQSFVIDGKDQGQHFAVRTPSNGNNPVQDVTSTSMICNGGTEADDTLEIAAGSEITMQWHHSDPGVTDGSDADEPIASSHLGPVMVYLAPADSNGEGAVWSKLYEDGLTDGKWGVDNFISNEGKITITLPDLAAGEYLIRPEIIALHSASTEGGAQFYNGCGQIKVTGSGSATLPTEGTDMTKAYSATDPGVLFNIYEGATTYPIPGPEVWDPASSGSDSTTPSETAAASSAAATSAAATSAAAPASSAAATSAAAEATPVQSEAATSAAATSAAATSAAAPSPSATQGSSSSTLPEEFSLSEFIAWLKETTGATGASKARRHARSFFG